MNISRKQLAALFICSLVPWSVGNGLIPLLPVYATQLGANSAVAGYYLAFSYLAIALGALSAGWISSILHRHKLALIIASLAGIPACWMMGQVKNIWGLTALTAVMWFSGGLGISIIGILTGLSAGVKERGKIFGILALTNGIGALAGGLGTGWLVEQRGYTSMFKILAVFMILWPLSAALLEDKEIKPPGPENTPRQVSQGLGKNFYLMFTISILSSITGFFVILIRSIVMNNLGFGPLEVTSMGAIGGLIGMPFPFLMGWLSDRKGRKIILAAGYLIGFASLVMLAFSHAFWHFWLVSGLQGISTATFSIGSAFITDLVPREAFGKSLAIFGSTGWIGGIIGFGAAGYLLQNLGFGPTVIIGGLLALAAAGLLIPIQAGSRKNRQPDTVPT